MDLQKLQMILAVAGGAALGLPIFLRSLRGGLQGASNFFKLIPGDQPEKAIDFIEAGVAKVEAVSEKIADVIGKLYPQAKK